MAGFLSIYFYFKKKGALPTIKPGCVFVLVAAPERIQIPAKIKGPAAPAPTRISVSELKPEFERRILEERRPPAHAHVSDDWFSLLDVDLKGILF